MNLALYYWRATWRRQWRRVVTLALMFGLLGTVALGALAGARRTDSAYGRYLASINASDVAVNVPGPALASIRQIEHLPGVVSGRAWLGLVAEPVVKGKADDSFRVDALHGSLDGEYFRQDRATVVAGRLPRLDATAEIALTTQLARLFHTWVGGRVTYQFSRMNPRTGAVTPAGNSTFVVTGIVDPPPVLVDQFDDGGGALLPPAATARHLNGEFAFGWVGLRLRAGPAGIPTLQRELTGPENTLDHAFRLPAGAIAFGGTVTVGTGRYRRTLTIVGTVTMPSMGLSQADHVSLGRGAMLPESTLLATEGLSPQLTTEEEQSGASVSDPAFPSAVAIDLASGPDAAHLAARIDAAGPGDTPGGTYAQPRVRGAAIVYAAQMGSQPLALALALAVAAVLSLAVALLASVRERRRQLALLKALGLTRRQVREAIAWQATIILLVAVIVGVPLGIAAGRWAWTSFAASLGVVPVTVVPAQALLAGFIGLLVAGNLLTAVPASVAARTRAAVALRAE